MAENKEKTPRKVRIVETAIKLFARDGYHNTPISKIAKEAGVSKGLLYNYFESKDELLRYIFDTGSAKLLEKFDPNRDGVLTKEEFEFYIHDVFFDMVKEREYWMLFFNIAMQPAIQMIVIDSLMKILTPMMIELNNYFSEKGCPEPEARTRYFIAIMDGVGMHYIMDPENFPIEAVIEDIIAQFV